MLKIENLHINIEGKEIVKGINLEIGVGEIHALMGPNGSGKSTLAQALMGHPTYKITKGKVTLFGKNLLKMDSTQRSLAGLFLSFQYPSEVSGVNIANFLRLVYNKRAKKTLYPAVFRKLLKEKMEILDMKEEFMDRYLNEGFSGGEKKRMEILQMLVIEPKVAILDETDSGLDIDALKIVSNGVTLLNKTAKTGVLLITHYTRLLNHIKPDKVHVMRNGKIVKSGGHELANELEKKGYTAFEE